MSRHIPLLLLSCALFLSACASDPAGRTGRDSGPFSARAKNRLVEKDPAALRRTALGFENAGQCGAALSLYQQLLAVDPNDVASTRGLARCLAALGNSERGIAELEALYASSPTDAGIRSDLVGLYLKSMRLDDARALLSPLVEDGTPSILERLQYGIVLEILGAPEKARLIWDDVQQRAPGDLRAGRYLSMSFALDGSFDAAVALLQPLLDSPATAEKGRETLSYIYALSGQYQAALALARGVLTPQELDARRTMLKVLPRLSRADQASALFLNRISQDSMRALGAGDLTDGDGSS